MGPLDRVHTSHVENSTTKGDARLKTSRNEETLRREKNCPSLIAWWDGGDKKVGTQSGGLLGIWICEGKLVSALNMYVPWLLFRHIQELLAEEAEKSPRYGGRFLFRPSDI